MDSRWQMSCDRMEHERRMWDPVVECTKYSKDFIVKGTGTPLKVRTKVLKSKRKKDVDIPARVLHTYIPVPSNQSWERRPSQVLPELSNWTVVGQWFAVDWGSE